MRLVRMAGVHGLTLRQSYVRVAKKALIQHQRYAHAKQFKRAGKQLKRLKTWLGRTIRDIERQVRGNGALEQVFRAELWKCWVALLFRSLPRAINCKAYYGIVRPTNSLQFLSVVCCNLLTIAQRVCDGT